MNMLSLRKHPTRRNGKRRDVIAAVLGLLAGANSPGFVPVEGQMRILIQRSGGYAGILETLCDIDTASLDSASATELEQLALNAEATAKAAGGGQPIGADFLRYEVTLGDGRGERTWAIVDDNSAAVEPIHRLLNYISEHGLGGQQR